MSFLVNKGYKNVYGIDISQENIEFCLNKGFNVVESDILTYLIKHEEEFDCIIFNDVIEHLTKDEIFEVLFAIRKSLKVSNSLYESTVLIKTDNMNNPYVSFSGRYMDFTHEIGFTELSLEQVLKATGFNKIKIIGTNIYIFNNPINFLAKYLAKFICFNLFLKSYLFGRKTLKIFEKDILAIAKK